MDAFSGTLGHCIPMPVARLDDEAAKKKREKDKKACLGRSREPDDYCL